MWSICSPVSVFYKYDDMRKGTTMQGLPKEFEKRKFARYDEAAEYYGLGRTRFREIALDAGAVIKINQTVLVDLEIFENYINSFRLPPRE